jgi:acetyltransferase-like isoleucine patch superfamily enzyme
VAEGRVEGDAEAQARDPRLEPAAHGITAPPGMGVAPQRAGSAAPGERPSVLKVLRNFAAGHPPGVIARLLAEHYLGTLLRSFPSFEGVVMRYWLYRLLFKRLDGFAFIFPGARLDHCYGISAGRGFSVNSGAFVSGQGGLTIGDGVLIGPNAVIVSSQHRYDMPDRPICEQGLRFEPTTIGDDVWIGANEVVLSGVEIATGTIVSAGSVVTKNTEPYTIVGGVPARPIGERPRSAD